MILFEISDRIGVIGECQSPLQEKHLMDVADFFFMAVQCLDRVDA